MKCCAIIVCGGQFIRATVHQSTGLKLEMSWPYYVVLITPLHPVNPIGSCQPQALVV